MRVGTLGNDKGYDSGPHRIDLENRGVVPHAAMRAGVGGGGKGTSLRSMFQRASVPALQRMRERQAGPGYLVSQRCRKKSEEAFGWSKTVAGLYQTKLVGQWKLRHQV